jgi:short-subunit dehydrogenase
MVAITETGERASASPAVPSNVSRHAPVAVITGASSGLGRAAAVELARRGYAVALAARREADLAETARLCREEGGRAAHWVTDVTVEGDVRRLSKAVVAEFGGIDVWVNNAGVTLFAPLEEAPFEEHRRVIETNLFGAMHGARAVVPIFRAQGSGVLINVGSILSKIGHPFVPSYVISKFGLRGLSEALRVELADMRDVHVCTLFPYAIDTPHFEEGGNRVGYRPRAMQTVQSPKKVARALADLVEHPRRELHVPRVAALGLVLHALLPETVERLLLDSLARWHFDPTPESRTLGNLYQPSFGNAATTGLRPPRMSTLRFSVWAMKRLLALSVEGARVRLGLRREPSHIRARRPDVAGPDRQDGVGAPSHSSPFSNTPEVTS